jgi:glutamate transport system ATP-binding protein
MAVDPLIELYDVNKYFGELHVLQDVDLAVGKGEAVVIRPTRELSRNRASTAG